MLAYVAMMAPRLVELRRVMKPTASIYLHCDPTASHYLKLLMDSIFGPRGFQNEIVWYYRGAGVSPLRWGRRHDTLLFYAKGKEWTFNVDPVRDEYAEATKERFKHYIGNVRKGGDFGPQALNPKGKHPDDVWEISILAPSARERLGYPTQKPEPLLERVILASSNPGDVILDPFCGCGTTVAVAQRLDRKWIGIDVTHLAINLIRYRLQDHYGEGITGSYKVIGEPTSVEDARQLAEEDHYQFQWWALGLVGARPVEGKKGADAGIDGRIYFHDEGSGGKTKQIVFEVKSGGILLEQVRSLRGVLDRENAEIGVFISMLPFTAPMKKEAASAGFYKSPWGQHPRLQLLTVEELLEGKRIDMPPLRQTDRTFKKAARHVEEGPETPSLFEE